MLRKIVSSMALVALSVSTLAGCIVAEAASPESRNPATTALAPTPTATVELPPSPTPSASPIPSPTPAPVEAEPATEEAPWAAVNGEWCSPGYCARVIDFVMMDDYDDITYWMEQTDERDGCLFGEAISDMYPGASVAYCPAGVATPLDTLIEVSGDDPSQDRIWFYQGAGAETMFRR